MKTKGVLQKIIKRIRVYTALRYACRNTSDVLEKLTSIKRILVICYGNIYRSPFVEQYLNKNLASCYEIKSAGFYPKSNRCSSPEYIELCGKYGVDLNDHRSTVINKEIINKFDAIIIMDRHNWYNMQDYGYEILDKIIWLGCLLDKNKKEIIDPYGKPNETIEEILSELKEASDKLINVLNKQEI